MEIIRDEVAGLLNSKFLEYNHTRFIENDPISIPHRFQRKQDIEISGFFAAILAWGQRKTIIAKSTELLQRMDNSPYEFIVHSSDRNLRNLLGFKHRTFNEFDLLVFTDFLKHHYQHFESLEDAFLIGNNAAENVKNNLISFREYFFEKQEGKIRTSKHIPTPANKSACKRLNMFLRWMVRKDGNGVDFGIWTRLKPAQLVIPCDVHVENVARNLGLTQRENAGWEMATEITEVLKSLDSDDPVKYDFALFGMGVEGYFNLK